MPLHCKVGTKRGQRVGHRRSTSRAKWTCAACADSTRYRRLPFVVRSGGTLPPARLLRRRGHIARRQPSILGRVPLRCVDRGEQPGQLALRSRPPEYAEQGFALGANRGLVVHHRMLHSGRHCGTDGTCGAFSATSVRLPSRTRAGLGCGIVRAGGSHRRSFARVHDRRPECRRGQRLNGRSQVRLAPCANGVLVREAMHAAWSSRASVGGQAVAI